MSGSPDEARALEREGRWAAALARLGDGDGVLRAWLLRLLGRAAEARAVPLPDTPDGTRVRAAFATDAGDHAGAAALLARAEVAFREAGDRAGEVRAIVEQADAAAFAGALVRAEEGYRRALDLAADLPDRQADALNGLGAVFRYTGRLDEARAAHRDALRIAEAAGYPLGAHFALRGLGAVALAHGDATETRVRCEAARAIALRLGYRDGVVWCCNGLGEAARIAGDLDAAERWYRDALGDDVVGTRRVALLANLGLVEQRRGRMAASRAWLEEAFAFAEGPGGVGWRALLHGTMLAGCEATGDADAWRLHYARAVALLAETGEVEADLAQSLDLAAVLAERAGALGRAVRARALALDQWETLGRAPEAAAGRAALDRLAALGAPVPLGPFDLVEPIGAGAVGEVWRGTHHGLGTPVAVKVLAAASARAPERQAAFRAEVRAVATLDHPNVVAVLDHGLVSAAAERMSGGRLVAGSPFLVMELAEGGTLDALCGRLPWAACREALLQLCAGLAHAHARGVVHRDLKPANVLVDTVAPLALRISDFGLTSAVGEVAGTPATMAPEQFARGAAHGPATDLYALGCVATVLVSGRWPHAAEDFAGWRHAHLTAEPLPLAPAVDVPAGLEAWIARLLRKDPAERFRCAADAAFALASLGPPTVAPVAVAPVVTGNTSNATLTADDLDADVLPEVAAASGVAPCPVVRAPVPDDPGDPPAGRWWLPGAGLGLLALRAPPFVGRRAERAALWRRLVDAHRAGRTRVVTLVGEPGVGRTRLANWVVERAHEVGAAATHEEGEGLVVRIAEDGDDAVVVPPLSDAEIEILARDRLGLAPELAARFVGPARGRPQLVVQVVQDWLARGLLVAGERAFALRGGVEPPIPDDLAVVRAARLETFRAGPAMAVAAALGPVVDETAWRRACDDAGVPVPPGLVERLRDAGLIVEVGAGRWRIAR